MSAELEESVIVDLTERAAAARSRLASDIEALAYKVSPENLKQEAKDAGKAAVRRWGTNAVGVGLTYPVVVTAGVTSVALLYAAMNRRSRPLFAAAVLTGIGALFVGKRAPRLGSGRLLAAASR